jgi:hypothetical protein
MNVLRNGFIAALVALPFSMFGGACTVSGGGFLDPMDVAIGSGCTDDSECDPGSFCDQGTGVCTADGSIAVGGICNSDLDCDSGDCCDPDGLVCIACGAPASIAIGGTGCIDDAECDAGAYCDSSGDCVADPYASDLGSEALGATCYDDADCEAGDYCDIQTDTCQN